MTPAAIDPVSKKRTPEYRAWDAMANRCTRPTCDKFRYYGGRGIKVCDRWLKSFVSFVEDVGLRPSSGHSLDRYPNPNGGYEPGNVRWATKKEQMRNKSDNHLLTHNGRTAPMAVWAEEIGIPMRTMWARIKRGWSVEKAVTTPLKESYRA